MSWICIIFSFLLSGKAFYLFGTDNKVNITEVKPPKKCSKFLGVIVNFPDKQYVLCRFYDSPETYSLELSTFNTLYLRTYLKTQKIISFLRYKLKLDYK